jgi:cation diffusion facilitator family transporter
MSNRDPRAIVMAASLVASAVMLVGKMTAYMLTNSTAILSDAAESVVHGAATGFAAFGLWYASKPADTEHPYGHGRIAYFSAGFEGALVLAASIAVIYSGMVGLIQGSPLQNLGTGLIIASGLALVNLILGLTLIRTGRKHNAVILIANGRHVLTDVLTTAAAIVGVALVMLTGVQWLDPLAAIVIGLFIMVSGVSLVRQSVAGLMDKVDASLLEAVAATMKQQVASGLIADFHQLRCREINDAIWIDVHVLVPGDKPIFEAHADVTRAEQLVRASFPGKTVHIAPHIEPEEHALAHPQGEDAVAAGAGGPA